MLVDPRSQTELLKQLSLPYCTYVKAYMNLDYVIVYELHFYYQYHSIIINLVGSAIGLPTTSCQNYRKHIFIEMKYCSVSRPGCLEWLANVSQL